MAGSTFYNTLRFSWRSILLWGIGFAAMAMMVASVAQDVDALKEYANLVETLPPFMLQMIDLENAADMATPEGFIASGYFSRAVMIFIVFAIIAGIGITSNEEEAGIMDVVLSLPVPRWRVVLERFAAQFVAVLVISAFSTAGVWLGLQFTTLTVDIGALVNSSLALVPLALLMIAITMWFGVLTRRRGAALGLATLVIVGMYVLDILGGAASTTALGQVRNLSIFTYYDPMRAMRTGVDLAQTGLLLGLAALFTGATVWLFQRRDVGV